MARDKSGPKKIGLQVPKIVVRAAGNDPRRIKKLKKYLVEKNK